MRLSVGSIAASVMMAAVLISYWPGGPARSPLNTAQAQQAEKVKETPVPAPEKFDTNTQTRAKLEKLIDAAFVEMPLSQVLDNLADKINVQFHMDRKPMNDAGITSDTPITFHLKNVPAEMVLRLIFRDIGLTYYLDNGVIIVTTSDAAESRLETQVYCIDDLIYSSQAAKNQEAADSPAKKPIKVDYDGLIDLITSTVRPITWDQVGGPGSIYPYRGTLVISQTADVHQEIQKVLKDLRQSINPDIEDEVKPPSRGSATGGMGGGMGRMESSNKESEKKDAAQPSPEKEKKGPKDARGGMGMF